MTRNATRPPSSEREARLAEHPVREADVAADLDHRLDAAVGRPAVEAPEPAAVAAEPQRPVGRPRRLADRLPRVPAGDDGRVDARRTRRGGSRPTACPGGPTRASTTPRRRATTVARRRSPGPSTTTDGHGRRVGRQPHDRVRPPRRRRCGPRARTGSSSRPATRRRRRSAAPAAPPAPASARTGSPPSGPSAVQPLRRPVGEPQHAVAHPPRPAAVLVDGGAGVPRRRRAPRSTVPSAPRRSTAMRPPSSGRLSDHHTSSPSGGDAHRRRRPPAPRARSSPGSARSRRAASTWHGGYGGSRIGTMTTTGPAAPRNGDCELHYDTFGDPADPTLLLVNGLGSQCTNYKDAWCEMFADRGLQVIRFDNRDVGLSTSFAGAPVDEQGRRLPPARHGRRRLRRARRQRRRAGARDGPVDGRDDRADDGHRAPRADPVDDVGDVDDRRARVHEVEPRGAAPC